jgi:hypothetical protein
MDIGHVQNSKDRIDPLSKQKNNQITLPAGLLTESKAGRRLQVF